MADTKQLKKCSRCKCEILLETYFSKNRKGEYYSNCNKCRDSKKKPARLTLKECQEVAKSKGGKCLSTEYVNNHTKMEWECKKGHQWNAMFSNVKNKSWCIICAGKAKHTIQMCHEVAKSRSGKCLSTEYVNTDTSLKWQCKEGHTWEREFAGVRAGEWCRRCSGSFPYTLKECQEVAKSKGGKCLSTEYINARIKLKWECLEGHQWENQFHHIHLRNQWCPHCAGGKSENLCREIIEKYLLEPFPNTRPKFLEGLELDGYNKELNIAFEYNGKQHYEYLPHFHRNGEDDFEEQKERDRKKYRICREKKINLIIIPYQYDYTTPDELDDFIYTELCKII